MRRQNSFVKLLITIFLGPFGVHKFMDGNKKMGLIYLFTMGLFGLGWFFDIIRAICNLHKPIPDSTHMSVYDDYYSPYTDPRRDAIVHEYYRGLEEIETMWSVIYNLKITSGSQADLFEAKCYANIRALNNMLAFDKSVNLPATMPSHIPAYVRLAMLYEKQHRYDAAIDICTQAIKIGAVNDGSKGKMYGRLARLMKKSENVSID